MNDFLPLFLKHTFYIRVQKLLSPDFLWRVLVGLNVCFFFFLTKLNVCFFLIIIIYDMYIYTY